MAVASAACSDGGARAWTAATVDAGGIDDGERVLHSQAVDGIRLRRKRPQRRVVTASVRGRQ